MEGNGVNWGTFFSSEIVFRSGSVPPTGEEEDEEDVADSVEAKKAAKYQEWEERMRQLLDNKDEVNTEARSYGREFLGLCGEIVQESGEPKCPLGEDALKGFGLDRSSMPSQQQNYGGVSELFPSFFCYFINPRFYYPA